MHVTRAVKGVVEATVGDLDQVVLDLLALGQLCGVHELSRAELARPFLLVGVGVDRDDARRLDEGGSCYNAETDSAAAEDSDGGVL